MISVLQEQLGDKRPRLTDDQRRRLAAKGKPLGRRLLDNVAAIVTPDTILRCDRKADRGAPYLPVPRSARAHCTLHELLATPLDDTALAHWPSSTSVPFAPLFSLSGS